MSTPQRELLFVFPGQGSQYPGIGADLHAAYPQVRAIYDRASRVLGYDIAELSFQDPGGRIHLTRFTQPVLLTHSIACLTLLQELAGEGVTPQLAAGHSLGEYSALVATGALDFEQALTLVQRRGELMGEHGQGEMEALPLDVHTAAPLAQKHHCAVAACNLPEQTVVGGLGSDLDRLVAEIRRVPSPQAHRPPQDRGSVPHLLHGGGGAGVP